MDIKNAKLRGKTAVRGNAVAFWAITILIGIPVSVLSGMGSSFSNFKNLSQFSDGLIGLSMVGTIVGAIFSVLSAVAAIFIMPLTAGLSAKYLYVLRGGNRQDYSVLTYYRNKDWAEKIKAYLLVTIYVVIGSILCVIPGIILAIRYSMLGFVFADNPGINYSDAMRKTREITKGRGGQIFLFYLSFIGWYLLLIVTCGLSSIYSDPYQNMAFAALYDIYAERDGMTLADSTPDEPPTDGDSREDLPPLEGTFDFNAQDTIKF